MDELEVFDKIKIGLASFINTLNVSGIPGSGIFSPLTIAS